MRQLGEHVWVAWVASEGPAVFFSEIIGTAKAPGPNAEPVYRVFGKYLWMNETELLGSREQAQARAEERWARLKARSAHKANYR